MLGYGGDLSLHSECCGRLRSTGEHVTYLIVDQPPPATFTISSMSNPFNSEVDGRCYRFSHLVLLYNWEFQGRKRFEMKARHQVNEATYSLPYPILGRETSAYNTETRAHYGYEATLTCGPFALPTGTILEQLRP